MKKVVTMELAEHYITHLIGSNKVGLNKDCQLVN